MNFSIRLRVNLRVITSVCIADNVGRLQFVNKLFLRINFENSSVEAAFLGSNFAIRCSKLDSVTRNTGYSLYLKEFSDEELQMPTPDLDISYIQGHSQKFFEGVFLIFFIWTAKFRLCFGIFSLKNPSKLKNISVEGGVLTPKLPLRYASANNWPRPYLYLD